MMRIREMILNEQTACVQGQDGHPYLENHTLKTFKELINQ